MVPIALRAASKLNPRNADALEAAAVRCEREGTVESARAARTDAYDAVAADAAAAYAAAAYAKIKFLTELIDEYDRITGRIAPADIPAERWEGLRLALTGE